MDLGVKVTLNDYFFLFGGGAVDDAINILGELLDGRGEMVFNIALFGEDGVLTIASTWSLPENCVPSTISG